ncbi:uncharacterized protein LOC123273425 [Cotesia glomerata]|nr:uncharacterized protein LOC123273425 [Cotesia glomerata]
MLYERSYVADISIAAHEVAHSLGVKYSQVVSLENLNTNWSEFSTKTLHQISRNSTFSCLYNKPNFTNPLLEEEEDDPLTSNGKWLEFYMSASKDFRELINPREFYINKAIVVSFKNNKIVVQLVDKSTFTRRNISIEYNIQRIVPDYEKIIIDLAVINRMKNINIFYENKSIHVYQEIHEEAGRKNQALTPLYVTANSEDIITIEVPVFDRNKLLAVFYENNKLIVTQETKIEDDKEFSGYDVIDFNYQYATVSDDMKVYIRPFQLNFDSILRIYHKKTSIYISQISNCKNN